MMRRGGMGHTRQGCTFAQGQVGEPAFFQQINARLDQGVAKISVVMRFGGLVLHGGKLERGLDSVKMGNLDSVK